MKHIVHIALQSYILWLLIALGTFAFVLPNIIWLLDVVLTAIGSFGQGWS